MKRRNTLLAAMALCAVCAVAYAEYEVADRGLWPATWPKELEPLRMQARTLVGPMVSNQHFEIPFTKREDFEKAWPQLLKVKTKGAPIILVRAPYTFLGANIKAGVVVHSPPANTDKRANPETPIPAQSNPRTTWMRTTYIELVVDGSIVDLNRILLPSDTPLIDERFKGR